MNNMNKIISTIDNKIDSNLPQTPEAIRRRRNRLLIPIGVIALGGALFIGGTEIATSISDPTFSSETTTYTIEDGQGLYDAAEQIENLGDIRDGIVYIEGMPENQDILVDGLNPGEVLTIPVEVIDK